MRSASQGSFSAVLPDATLGRGTTGGPVGEGTCSAPSGPSAKSTGFALSRAQRYSSLRAASPATEFFQSSGGDVTPQNPLASKASRIRSEEHTSELQSHSE